MRESRNVPDMRRSLAVIVLVALFCLVSACSLMPQATPTGVPPLTPERQSPTATRTTAATSATPTSIATATAAVPTPQPATATPLPPTATALPVPPTATPSPAPPTATAVTSPPFCLSPKTRVDLFAGPGRSYPVVVTLGVSEELRPVARDAQGVWMQVVTLDGIQGWLILDMSRCQYLDLSRLPVVTITPVATPALPPTPAPPPPSPTPTELVITDWRGEYYDNPNLAGNPVLLRNDGAVNFDWGEGSPDPALPAANFSVRWSRSLSFAAGYYRFYLRADDGARLFIDDVLMLDMWQPGALRTQSVNIAVTLGTHRVRVEYFQNTGAAAVAAWWELAPFADWRAEYYTDPNLSTGPFLVRNDQKIDFNWSQSPPRAGMSLTGYSVRWTRAVGFDAGIYRFQVRADDGVRLWIDNNLAIDEWHLGSGTYSRDLTITAGAHNLRVEYFQNTGDAYISVNWSRLPDVFHNFRGEYYDNRSLVGNPVLLRDDPVIDFIWSQSGPDPRIDRSSFSARWTGRPGIDPGTYRLRVESGGGVRVWINDVLMIDAWRPGALTAQTTMTIDNRGAQSVRVEYFQQGPDARIHVWWVKQTGSVQQ